MRTASSSETPERSGSSRFTASNGGTLWPAAAVACLLAVGFRQRARQVSAADAAEREISAAPDAAKKPSPTTAGGWKAILREIKNDITRGRIVAIAAGVTFYALLAVFPAIASLVALYGLFADPARIAQQLDLLAGLLPEGAITVVHDEITRIASQGGGTLGLTFIVGLLISLWSANGGVKALFDALNVVYRVDEERSFIKLNSVSLTFVVAGVLFLMLAISAVVAFPVASLFFGDGWAKWIVALVEWPLMFAVLAVALELIYRYGPSHTGHEWRWLSWGSAFAAFTWIVASLLFSWYAANFGSFNKTYGSLGAVMGFMTWIWISAIVVLLGADINAVIGRLSSPPRRTARPYAVAVQSG
jgi:membrane protein